MKVKIVQAIVSKNPYGEIVLSVVDNKGRLWSRYITKQGKIMWEQVELPEEIE